MQWHVSLVDKVGSVLASLKVLVVESSVQHLDDDDDDDYDQIRSDQTLMSEKGWIGTGLARCLCSLPLWG